VKKKEAKKRKEKKHFAFTFVFAVTQYLINAVHISLLIIGLSHIQGRRPDDSGEGH